MAAACVIACAVMPGGESAPPTDPHEAERLLIAAAQQDPRRFAELYERNFERVYAYIVRRVRDRDAAQDLTADVFHQALANLSRFEWRGVPFAAWLFRIAANAIADGANRAARERALPASDEPLSADLEETEERARLFRLVTRLPDDQRQVVAMRFAEQRSIREIAVHLGRSEGAIKQLQLRGLQKLRRWLSQPNA
jgi:RNA polymerase sigma-70 factor (ECF subfamily)